MNKKIPYLKLFGLAFVYAFVMVSCTKEAEPYNNPFIYIGQEGRPSATATSEGRFVGEYTIYLSSKKMEEELTVTYSVTPGNGLKEGVDYQLITSKEVKFLPGFFDMPIRILWLPNKLDETKDNTLTIRLETNSMNFNMGLPGPDNLQRTFVITKF